MCGIFGIVDHSRGQCLSNCQLNSLKNRGPDGEGKYLDICEGVGLFHTRLAVIDHKETSNQPIMSPCGNYILVCNGEVYNYQDLKRIYSDYDYQTTSDCEVILACYYQDGIEGFKKLRGMFSFGLYDKINKILLIYRDPVGKKPLFHYFNGKSLLFSSNITSICDNIPNSLTINYQAILSYFKHGYIHPTISFYQEINPVLPGSLITFDIHSLNLTSTYLSPEIDTYDGFEYVHDSILSTAKDLLRKAVETRIHNTQAPVLLFSGGIDSTILAKLIPEMASNRLFCIGLKPLIPFTNDDFYARYAARKLNVTYKAVDLEFKTLRENLNYAISLLDQPLSLYSYFFLTYLVRKAREFGNVLFTGDGGDEVFYGYSDINLWFSQDNPKNLPHNCLQIGPPLNLQLSNWGIHLRTEALLGHAFVKVDKSTAEQQMEARCPFLDWELMNFVRTIPSEYFLKSETTKPILKDVLYNFPRWFKNRKKVGFTYNFRYLMFPLYPYIYNEINYEKLLDMGIIKKPKNFSYRLVFKQFDWFWKFYILSKFV